MSSITPPSSPTHQFNVPSQTPAISNVTGSIEENFDALSIYRQNIDALFDTFDAQSTSSVRFTSEEIRAVKTERKESLFKLNEEIKTLSSDLKKAKYDAKKAYRNLTKAAKVLVEAHNSHRTKGADKLTEEEFLALCNANEFNAERMEGFLNKYTSPLFGAVADAAQAGVKVVAKGKEIKVSRKEKRAERKDLVALIRGARNNNANVLAELQAKRQAERASLQGILGFFNRGEG